MMKQQALTLSLLFAVAGGQAQPVEEAATILTDLADTIRTTESGSRLLVTSHSAFGAEPAGTL